MPVIFAGFAGQAGILIIGLSLIISCTPTAPVGFGAAAGTPPNVAHVPTATTAALSFATLLRCSSKVSAFAPIVHHSLPLPIGIEPSTTHRYLPLNVFIASSRCSSALCPAAAIRVSLNSKDIVSRISSSIVGESLLKIASELPAQS